jgi:acylpyruvate hydrolase
MRLATVRDGTATWAARVEGDELVEVGGADVGDVLRRGSASGSGGAEPMPGGRRVLLADADLAPVVPRPDKIVCLGRSYRSHILEQSAEVPAHPTLFAKFARALIGARDPIRLPAASANVDWEVELAFVIGRTVRHADPDEARAAIAGYTVLNDVSMRDWQNRTNQWLQGKTFEGSTPVGPVLVTGDEVDDARDLVLRCEVDGQLMQEGRTSDLLWSPVEIVQYLSTVITLDPGDVISTGTPGGVGMARTPPVWLQPGQVVRTSIEGIGELVNRCRPEDPEGPTPG